MSGWEGGREEKGTTETPTDRQGRLPTLPGRELTQRNAELSSFSLLYCLAFLFTFSLLHRKLPRFSRQKTPQISPRTTSPLRNVTQKRDPCCFRRREGFYFFSREVLSMGAKCADLAICELRESDDTFGTDKKLAHNTEKNYS